MKSENLCKQRVSGATIKKRLFHTSYRALLRTGFAVAGVFMTFSSGAQMLDWYSDTDGDGFGNITLMQSGITQPPGYVLNSMDCNDNTANASVWNGIGNAGFSPGVAGYTSVAVAPNGNTYVVYRDYANSDRASVMKYDGTNWLTVGASGFSAGQASHTSIAIDATGVPYVAYEDGGNSFRVTVMKYDGNNWVAVGSPGFSTATGAPYTDIAIDAGGTPYVTFQDYGNSSKASVMKYDGNSWVPVGSLGFSPGSVEYTSIVIAANGIPYVVFRDGANGNKASVMKFNSNAWENVGAAGFSAGQANDAGIAMGGNGQLFVAYQDAANGNKATVMKYDGSNWTTVGTPGFSSGAANSISIAADAANVPYVAYSDAANADAATIMKYDGNNWVVIGGTGISAGIADYISIATDAQGVPRIVYQDGGNSGKATVMAMRPESLGNPTVPTAASSASTVCSGSDVQLNVTNGTLGDAANWHWYTSSCGGALVGVGSSVTINPTSTETYYVRGEGDCVLPGTCDMVLITADPTPVVTMDPLGSTTVEVGMPAFALPNATPAGGTYSGPGVSGNMFDPAVAGVGTHWLTYTYTNNFNCSSTDSAEITVSFNLGVAQANSSRFIIYPNPASSEVFVSLGSIHKSTVIVIKDMTGRDVRAAKFTNTDKAALKMEDLAGGVYFLSINADDQHSTLKIIKK